MYTTVTLDLVRHPDAIQLPAAAVEGVGGKNGYVFVVDDDSLIKKPVSLGITDGRYVEITSGLNGNESVVATISPALNQGEQIQPRSHHDGQVVNESSRNCERPMIRFLAAASLTLMLTFPAGAIGAEVPIRQGQELTLEQAVHIALTLHPRILASASELGAAHEGVGIAESQLLPQAYGVGEYLRGTDNGIGDTAYIGGYEFPRLPGTQHERSADAGQSFSTHDNYLAGLSIRQYLFDFGRVRGLIHEQQYEADAAKARYDLAPESDPRSVPALFRRACDRARIKVYEKSVEQRRSTCTKRG